MLVCELVLKHWSMLALCYNQHLGWNNFLRSWCSGCRRLNWEIWSSLIPTYSSFPAVQIVVGTELSSSNVDSIETQGQSFTMNFSSVCNETGSVRAISTAVCIKVKAQNFWTRLEAHRAASSPASCLDLTQIPSLQPSSHTGLLAKWDHHLWRYLLG